MLTRNMGTEGDLSTKINRMYNKEIEVFQDTVLIVNPVTHSRACRNPAINVGTIESLVQTPRNAHYLAPRQMKIRTQKTNTRIFPCGSEAMHIFSPPVYFRYSK